MKHIIIFCYIITILVGVSALTIQMLSRNKSKKHEDKYLTLFMWGLVVMNLYDFFIYYNDNILLGVNRVLILSIGDCLIAIVVMLWLLVQRDLVKDKGKTMVHIAATYIALYFMVWIVAGFLTEGRQLIRVIIDIPLIILLVVSSCFYLYKSCQANIKKWIIISQGVVAFFMLLTYGTYFMQESGLYNNVSFISRSTMDLTIFYWLVINVINLLYYYKCRYKENREETVATLEETLEMAKTKYNLTNRETELTREICEGKTNAQIAEKLYISESTVKAHIYNIFKKMDAKNRMEIICKVRETGG